MELVKGHARNLDYGSRGPAGARTREDLGQLGRVQLKVDCITGEGSAT